MFVKGPILAWYCLIFVLLRGVIEETTWLTKVKDGLDGRELACQRTGFSSKWSLDKWRFNLKKVVHCRKGSVGHARQFLSTGKQRHIAARKANVKLGLINSNVKLQNV